MLSALIVPVASIVANLSTSIAIQSAAKIITPPLTGAVTSFAIKVGAGVLGGVVGMQVARVVTRNGKIVEDAIKAQTATDSTPPEVL